MVKLHRAAFAGIAFIAIAGLAATASAESAFNDFDHNTNGGFGYHNADPGSQISGPNIFGEEYLGEAMQFTSLASGELTSVDLALWLSAGQVDVVLGAGLTPGLTELDSWTMISPPNGYSNSSEFMPTHLAANENVQLTAGTTYWLEVLPDTQSTLAGWYSNSTGAVGARDSSDDCVWTPQIGGYGAFDVSVTPEPFTLGLGAAGIALAIRRRFKSRRA